MQEKRQEKEDNGIDARKAKAIAALIGGQNREEAAKSAGVSARTLRNWFHDDPIFAARYADATEELVEDARLRASRILDTSLAKLETSLSGPAFLTDTGDFIAAARLSLDAVARLAPKPRD